MRFDDLLKNGQIVKENTTKEKLAEFFGICGKRIEEHIKIKPRERLF